MEFDDLFENKQNKHKNYRQQQYYNDNKYSHDSNYSNHENRAHNKWLDILNKIKENKKIRNLLIIGVIIFLFLLIGLIIILFPQLMRLFNYIIENGLQGVISAVTDFLNKIIKGS